MRHYSTPLLALAAWFSLLGCNTVEGPSAVYSVKEYNPARDPAVDLSATVKEAQAGNKRILLQVGGEWCGWCHKLDKYVAEHPVVAGALRDNFIIMKVNYSDENDNADFLSQYPQVDGYPHFFVLDGEGNFLHSQGTAELEEESSYREPAVLEFLSTWTG